MEDLVCLLPPSNDLIDPFGSRRWEGGNVGLHHAFVDFGRLVDEKGVLLGILNHRWHQRKICGVRCQSTDLANVDFGRREDDVYFDISDGLETTEVPRVLFMDFIRRYLEIWRNRWRTMSLCSIFSTSWTI